MLTRTLGLLPLVDFSQRLRSSESRILEKKSHIFSGIRFTFIKNTY
jgi:hypothetical protein